jgi:hypothetical protein
MTTTMNYHTIFNVKYIFFFDEFKEKKKKQPNGMRCVLMNGENAWLKIQVCILMNLSNNRSKVKKLFLKFRLLSLLQEVNPNT